VKGLEEEIDGSLPVLQQDGLVIATRFNLPRVHRRYRVEEAFHRLHVLLRTELLVQLHSEFLLGVLLRRAGTHEIAQRLDRLRDEGECAICLEILEVNKRRRLENYRKFPAEASTFGHSSSKPTASQKRHPISNRRRMSSTCPPRSEAINSRSDLQAGIWRQNRLRNCF
jgi:hypothetical protein